LLIENQKAERDVFGQFSTQKSAFSIFSFLPELPVTGRGW